MIRTVPHLPGMRGSSGRTSRGQHKGWSGAHGLVRPKDKKKAVRNSQKTLWLITFSDLMTLMLALFVLIFTMSSMESSMLEGISRGLGKDRIQSRGLGRIQDNVLLASRMLKEPFDAVRDEPLLRDLLFKNIKLPNVLPKGDLQDNIKIIERQQGVAIVLADSLLFEPGSVHLPENGRVILQKLAQLVRAYGRNVFISGHGDTAEGAGQQTGAPDSYRLSAQRALTVLEFFIAEGADPHLLSFTGYGKDRPMDDPKTQGNSDSNFNRRVEIIFKTDNWNGR